MIDTAAKRLEMLAFGELAPVPAPRADRIIGSRERHTFLGLYGADAPPATNEFVRTRSRRDPQFSGKRERP